MHALAQLPNDVRLELRGQSSDPGRLEQLARAYAIEDRVRFSSAEPGDAELRRASVDDEALGGCLDGGPSPRSERRVSKADHLIVVGPLPPPTHGVSVSTRLVLDNRELHRSFETVEHLDTSDHRTGQNIGRWDVTNVALALQQAARLVVRLRGRRGVVYVPFAQNLPGFLRDSLFIHLARLMGWNVAAHLHGSEFRSLFYERQGRLARWWVRITLRRTTAVAVLGTGLREVFAGLVPDHRLAVVGNGTVDPGTTSLATEPGRILFLSSLRRRKGLIEALEAADIVLERHPSAHFVFAGDWATAESEARQRAERWGERIQFREAVTGQAKDRLMASAWIFLFPPVLPEGHSRVVLESLAAGIPIVTTDRGANAETVVDGECGFVLADPIPGELADRLLRLLEDDELRNRMSRNARQRFLDRFTQEHADRCLAEWLTNVANHAGGSRGN